MKHQNFFIVSFFLVFILAASGTLFGQRVIDLDKVWGDMRVLGENSWDKLGSAVAYGDVNADGFLDIIIGAPWADPGTPARSIAGETYVIFGSGLSSPATIDLSTEKADITIYGKATSDCCGSALASGDVNGDGFDDIIIGVRLADSGDPGPLRTDAGETYVILGYSPSSPVTIDLSKKSPDITIYGAYVDGWSGYSVASGDVNGDGFDDIIIGAPEVLTTGARNAGKTYVIFGFNPSSPEIIDLKYKKADITVWGEFDNSKCGYALASGDVNADGLDDIIIGAPGASPGSPSRHKAGETYVIFGFSPSSPVDIDLYYESADITVCGNADYDSSGLAVASGDVNNDGFDDIIIGAPCAEPFDWPSDDDKGETYVIFGSSFASPPYTIDLLTDKPDITVCGAATKDNFGRAVASGDVNGDGFYDIIIGTYFADPGDPARTDAGETFVIFGFSPSSPEIIYLHKKSAHITIYGKASGDYCSAALACGDIIADGFDDIIIGAYLAEPSGRTDAGETYVIAGGGAFITAHGLGGKSWIKQFNLLGRDWGSFKAFGAVNSQGEVHLAVGDVDADSMDEIAAGQGEGGKSWVKLFEVDGYQYPISTFKAFGAANTNGELHMAMGNFDADPSDNEIAIAQGEGGQSWVKVFETDGTFITSFKAFGAPNAQGEVHLAASDLESADGIDEIVAGMGEGGSSRVKIFNYDGTLIRSFKAFDATDNPGGEVRLAVGNFDADPAVEIAAATGYNGGNKVRLFDKDGTSIGEFTAFGFGGNTNGDVQIAAADIDNDGIDEIICGHGEGGSSMVKVFKADGTFIRSFKAFGAVNAQGEVHLGKSDY